MQKMSDSNSMSNCFGLQSSKSDHVAFCLLLNKVEVNTESASGCSIYQIEKVFFETALIPILLKAR